MFSHAIRIHYMFNSHPGIGDFVPAWVCLDYDDIFIQCTHGWLLTKTVCLADFWIMQLWRTQNGHVDTRLVLQYLLGIWLGYKWLCKLTRIGTWYIVVGPFPSPFDKQETRWARIHRTASSITGCRNKVLVIGCSITMSRPQYSARIMYATVYFIVRLPTTTEGTDSSPSGPKLSWSMFDPDNFSTVIDRYLQVIKYIDWFLPSLQVKRFINLRI